MSLALLINNLHPANAGLIYFSFTSIGVVF